ncbi:hypothetical protein D0Z07_8277 [Hyphodiscus hymeniophilus]|uniref:Uncharacterized protein n=1 Tax=Hyphodiscus hymeniophilus TaxID=353542 RepID=A0A9P6VDM4_9HELO|nr:hypothetical protein D0Z07_8277 [Hyphodiscus hymeniophilus]
MTLLPSSSSPSKRPRLSLQIKTPSAAQTFGNSSTALKTDVDPTSPTAFNTLSNAYAAAIENASPRTARPPPDLKKPTSLRLETRILTGDDYIHPSQRTQTPGPFSITYPDTPSSAFPDSTPTTARLESKPVTSAITPSTASAFTFTPPQSAGSDKPMARVFTFAANLNTGAPSSPKTPRRRITMGIATQGQTAPYTHPRALHSILRNSPLPPRSVPTPLTPSRVSMRLANRASKKVGYNDPLTQTITTNKYVKSHIDLLSEDSPFSAEEVDKEKLETLDVTMAYIGDETRDGGQTPGPFEEMRRRMADSDLETPGSRKRKRKEKKRKWEWTITTPEDEQGVDDLRPTKTPLTAVMVEKTPATAIWRGASVSSDSDTDAGQSETEDFRNVSVDLSEDSEMSDIIPHSNLQNTRDSIEHSVEGSCSPPPL